MDKKKIDKLDAKIKKIKLPRGEGSISWARKDNCLVQYKKTIKFPDGTTKRLSVTAHEIDPLYALMREKEQEEQNNWKDTTSIKSDTKYSNIILQEAIERWFYKFKYINKKERSFDREECTLKNQILAYPSFAKLQMHVINDIKIQDHITMIAGKHSYSTTKKTYELLNQFFKYYYSNDINNNPMNTVIKPNERTVSEISIYETKDIRFFDQNEIDIFIAECTKTWSTGSLKYKFGYGLAFILYTGLRSGEALSLKWSDIDFKNKYVYVNTAATRKRERDSDMLPTGKFINYIGDTKTKAGNRKVYLLKNAQYYIEKLKEVQKPKSEDEYIFSGKNNFPISHRTLYNTFKLICKNCGIINNDENIGLHVLRHTFVSFLCREGVDKMVIANIVGQSDTKMIERVYYHITQDEKDNAIKAIEDRMKRIDK